MSLQIYSIKLYKKETPAVVFSCESWRISNKCFYKTLWTAAFVNLVVLFTVPPRLFAILKNIFIYLFISLLIVDLT